MSKPTMNLEGLLTEKPMAQAAGLDRGKRLSLLIDLPTYKRLRQHALDHDMTHQDILERALLNYLDSRG